MTELAKRQAHLLEVSLDAFEDGHLEINVTELGDPRFTLQTNDGKQALDMYYHPFAYYSERSDA